MYEIREISTGREGRAAHVADAVVARVSDVQHVAPGGDERR